MSTSPSRVFMPKILPYGLLLNASPLLLNASPSPPHPQTNKASHLEPLMRAGLKAGLGLGGGGLAALGLGLAGAGAGNEAGARAVGLAQNEAGQGRPGKAGRKTGQGR